MLAFNYQRSKSDFVFSLRYHAQMNLPYPPLIIVGANGFLGKNLSNYASDFTVVHSLESNEFDLPRNLQKSSVFVYLRAISSPTYVQANPIISNKINIENSHKFLNEALKKGHKVIFASSDIIYGHSEIKVFSENDEVNPWGLYAKQKNFIEKTFAGHENFLSLRLSLVTGEGSKLEKILQVESPSKITKGIVRNPVHITFFLKTIRTLSTLDSFQEHFPTNSLNIGGNKPIEIFDLASNIARRKGFSMPVAVQRELVDYDARPSITRINSRVAEDLVGIQFTA